MTDSLYERKRQTIKFMIMHYEYLPRLVKSFTDMPTYDKQQMFDYYEERADNYRAELLVLETQHELGLI